MSESPQTSDASPPLTLIEEICGRFEAAWIAGERPLIETYLTAAPDVARALLPEQGTDIKGRMCSLGELLEISGYNRRPKDLDDLLHILDSELRLVTPTDPEAVASEAGEADPTGKKPEKFYQLTHDYLVPALRDWLTRKQRETRRGRAELRLSERTAIWSIKPEKRNLPGWREWASVRLFTRRRNWSSAQQRMMRAAGRHYALRAVVRGVILGSIGYAIFEAASFVSAFNVVFAGDKSSKPMNVTETCERLRPHRRWATMILRQMIDKQENPAKRAEECQLLVMLDAREVTLACSYLLKAEPNEYRDLRTALWETREKAAPLLWAVLAESGTEPQVRQRAICALAYYDPQSPRWEAIADEAALVLCKQGASRSNLIPGRPSGASSLIEE